MVLVTQGPPAVIGLLMNAICDKLKADYYLEGEAKRMAHSFFAVAVMDDSIACKMDLSTLTAELQTPLA